MTLLRNTALAACGVVLVAGACSGAGDRSPRPPDLVVVVMDTVRADHMSLYGYPRRTTPRLDRLADEAVVFDTAYSVSSWTAPAHASLFTGLLPHEHHCTQERWILDTPAPTLAERLAAAGYQTFAVVDNPVLAKENGYARGFQRYVETWRGDGPAGADPTVPALDRMLAQRDPDRPFFLFVNLIEPHNPFDSSRQFMGTFVTDGDPALLGHDPRAFYLGQRRYDEAELDQLAGMYDAEILYTDSVVGDLLTRLKAEGVYDDTLLVVTADHGENIGDHGHVGHLFSLYESTVRVPLLIRAPSGFAPGTRDRRPVQLIDVAPTLLAAAGISHEPLTGIDLGDPAGPEHRPLLLEYGRPVQALLTFGPARDDPRLDPYRQRLRSVVLDGKKLIVGERGAVELYDVERDVAELRPLDDPGVTQRLSETIDRLIAGAAAPADGVATEIRPDDETMEALRALGYVK